MLLLICVVSVVSHEEGKRRRKNIRVPRETLWERTNRYHEGTK